MECKKGCRRAPGQGCGSDFAQSGLKGDGAKVGHGRPEMRFLEEGDDDGLLPTGRHHPEAEPRVETGSGWPTRPPET